MTMVSMVWGVLAFIAMVVGFFPCVNAINWVNVPFASVGLVLSIVAVVIARRTPNSAIALAGLVTNAIAVTIGIIRIALGNGIF